ncbi:MAG: glycosyltransferase family 1 protein, partial [Leptolyngbyaceae cyanobacterium bins.59]|nr:glycosyltransferase family 1 protein [Leptolyngbyaceae cyanobacterium bins.59]
MTMLRVAYDISIPVRFYDSAIQESSGVLRVTEEVLAELSRRSDLAVTAVRLGQDFQQEDDPLYRALNYWAYVNDHADRFGCRFAPPFGSRLHLLSLYQWVYQTCFSNTFPQAPWPPRLVFRILRRLLSQLQRVDLYPGFQPQQFDVYHSTFAKLPPISLTGPVQRVITIYDMIPVLASEFVGDAMKVFFQTILESIHLERDWVICISEFTRQQFCQYTGMTSDRVSVSPLAVSSQFQPVTDAQVLSEVRQRYGIPDGDYILSLGTFQPRKNLVTLIRAFDRLQTLAPSLDCPLVLVGAKGWMYDDIFAAARASAHLSNRIVFTGHVAETDLSAIYSAASLFVFPSLYEGFGLPPLEAMQCGVPVIAANTTSIPEVVGDAALLVDPLNSEEMAQKIAQ